MTKSNILVILGVITAIPAIILALNVCTYAIVGIGFLPIGNESINGARMFVAWLSSSLAVCLFGAASCA
jgi:hypothetical protein